MGRWQRRWSYGFGQARVRLMVGRVALIAVGVASCFAVSGGQISACKQPQAPIHSIE